jgi:aquaporin Z
MKKFLAEFLGTAVLVLVGCGAVTIGQHGSILSSGQALAPLAILPIGLAFGLAVMAMAYGIGPVSGCHINPAVTAAVWSSGRMPTGEAVGYVIAQFIGGIVGAAVLLFILQGKGGTPAGWDVAQSGLGENGWGVYANGKAYLGAYNVTAAVTVEFLATLIFTIVILGATSRAGATPVAGLAIGLTLALLHLPFINVTGLSVNPARSFGPALFVGGNALAQVWLFLVVPVIAGLVAGFLFRSKVLEAEA